MRNILIVDYEVAVANFAASILQSELGCQTTVAHTEPHAMALLHARKFDLIISDVFCVEPFSTALASSERWRWLATIHNLAPDTPLIATTAYTRFYYPAQNLIGLLSKPFKADELVEAALRALANGNNLPVGRVSDNPHFNPIRYQPRPAY